MRESVGIVVPILIAAGCSSREPVLSAAAGPATLIEELRIDGATEDLVPIGAVAVAEDGTMALTQRQDYVVRFFSMIGKALGAMGGRGQGPGEFASVGRVGWLGDTLWVSDFSLRRITLISPSRTLLRTLTFQAEAGPAPGDVGRVPTFPFLIPTGMFPDGSIHASLQLGAGQDAPELFRNHTAYGRVSPTGIVERIIARMPIGDVQLNLPEGSVPWPFPNRTIHEVSPDASRTAVAVASLEGADAGTFSVTVLGAQGDTVFSRHYPFESVPIPAGVGDSVIAASASRISHPVLAAAFRRGARVPPVYPPLQGLVLGRDGTIWVQITGRGEERQYVVLGSDGDPLGTVLLPSRSRVAAASRERMWVIERDEVNLESVVRYQVVWR